jgi:hypothetical protein
MLELWETKHEEEDYITGNDPNIVMELQECDFIKFFTVFGMRAQLGLLEHLF